MYKTLKIRLRLTENQKDHLHIYEEMYHLQLFEILEQFRSHPRQLNFHSLQFQATIEQHSQWNVYQIALRLYRSELQQKLPQYNASSSWNIKSFHLEEERLTLLYGKAFFQKSDILILCPQEGYTSSLYENRIIKLDLVHDEKYWYANFLIMKKEQNA